MPAFGEHLSRPQTSRSRSAEGHLAAEGLTNPEIGHRLFISRRTVQTHLAHAFRKLDLSSRVELAAEAADAAASDDLRGTMLSTCDAGTGRAA